MYGSQYTGNYQTPPQPEWQQQHPPPPPPPANAYNPNTYGPIQPSTSPAPGLDTTSWGVRYNQNAPPPPLPPRTGLSPPPSSYSSPLATTAPPLPTRPVAAETNSWDYGAGYNQPSQSPVPPPRPPLPAAYQNEAQQNAQAWQPPQQPYVPQYSHHAPTHHYDPSTPPPAPPPQSHTPTYPAGNHAPHPSMSYYQPPPMDQHPVAPPVSSPAPPTMSPPPGPPPGHPSRPPSGPPSGPPPGHPPGPPTHTGPQTSQGTSGASALGFGNPSDWEYLSATPGDVDDDHLYQQNATSVQSHTQPAPQNQIYQPVQSQSPVSSHVSNSAFSAPMQSTPAADAAPDHQAVPHSTRPARDDSVRSEYSAVSSMGRSETIDGVIQAWNQPVSPVIRPQDEDYSQSPVSASAKPASPPVQSNLQAPPPPNTYSEPKSSSPMKAPPDADSRGQTAPSDQIRNATPGASEKPAKPVDPYDDLDPWSKSSLFRYVTMLRKEAVAESDEEKFKIFTGFVAKETRLREVLYNIEHVAKESKPSSDVTPPEPLKPKSDNKTEQKNVDRSDESGLIPVESEYFPANTVASSAQSPDVDDIPYSPGGRPILSRPYTAQGVKNQHASLQRSASNPSGRGSSPLTKVSPAQLESDLAIRSTSVPPQSATSEKPMAPLKPDSPQPAYTPFRYAEGPQRGSESLNIVQPAYQAYSALRQASAESGRAMSGAPVETGLSVPGSAPSDETFLGIIREKSVSYRGKSPSLGSGQSVIEELGALIPSPFPIVEPSPEVASIEKKMEIYSDDFRYIPVATESWELSARDRRDKLDKMRLTRQEKSEEHIDSLFNDKEIGYADINPLEEEFRQKEARTQLDEERKELEHFIRNVFNPLNSRLKEEIVELRALNQRAMEELKRQTVQGDHSSANYQISHTMKTVNTLAAKLEDRFQKRLDIALEREQRRKRAERRPYVFLGDSRALKKLDVDFERMEKQNIVEAAKDRDERANKLTDLFDGAILCALGNHQRLLDDIASKTKKLDANSSKTNNLSESDTEMVMRSILGLTKLLVDDAEAMLTSFKTADSLLNEADYKVSVAEAQYSNANPDIFRQLDDEKQKEDGKIQEDHASKLESVRQGPAQTNATIDQVLQAMNKEPGSGAGPWKRPAAITLPVANSTSTSNSPPPPSTVKPVIEEQQQQHPGEALMPGHRPRAPSTETEQQERLRKALEEAKKRNAAKNYTS